jgi:hypothetical protein
VTSAAGTASALGLILLAAAGCTHAASAPPSVLSDGSRARPPPVDLDGVEGPAVATHARVLHARDLSPASPGSRCVGDRNLILVERIGVSAVTVTFRDRRRRGLYACDATTAAAHGTTWCGHAFARLHSGRLRDPRLSVTCRNADDEPRGFAWIQPVADTAYVVVARTGYSEVHAVAAGLPVRVTTDDVDPNGSGASFSVSEHASDGRRLRAYVLVARVSG